VLTAGELASKEILRALLFSDPSVWRLRKVQQISPLTHDSWRSRTSFQLLIHRALLQAAWTRAFRGPGAQPPLPDNDVDLVLPIDFLPKRVLLDFSLEGPDGKGLALFTSSAASQISAEMFSLFVEDLDASVDDGRHRASEFLEQNRPIVDCLISTGQNDARRALEGFAVTHRRDPDPREFRRGMSLLYESVVSRLGGDPSTFAEIDYELALRAEASHAVLAATPPALRALVDGAPAWSPFLNPALLVGDFVRLRGEPPTRQLLVTFFELCDRYRTHLADLQDDEERFPYLARFLSKLTDQYIAYARVRVPIDRDFVIKIDQIVPLAVSLGARLVGGLRYQNYAVALGGSRSSHVEISCEHPVELEQIPARSRIVVGRRTLPVETVFSVGSHSTRYHQHFYTNRSVEDVRRALAAAGRGADGQGYIFLRIYYTIEAATIYGYRIVSALAVAALVLFVRLYEPSSLGRSQLQFVSVIPFFSGFLGALSALRPQENVVAIRVRKHKLFVLAIVGATLGHFFLGLLVHGWPEAVRTWLGGLPVAGSLVR
jgi:hypothetical protein